MSSSKTTKNVWARFLAIAGLMLLGFTTISATGYAQMDAYHYGPNGEIVGPNGSPVQAGGSSSGQTPPTGPGQGQPPAAGQQQGQAGQPTQPQPSTQTGTGTNVSPKVPSEVGGVRVSSILFGIVGLLVIAAVIAGIIKLVKGGKKSPTPKKLETPETVQKPEFAAPPTSATDVAPSTPKVVRPGPPASVLPKPPASSEPASAAPAAAAPAPKAPPSTDAVDADKTAKPADDGGAASETVTLAFALIAILCFGVSAQAQRVDIQLYPGATAPGTSVVSTLTSAGFPLTNLAACGVSLPGAGCSVDHVVGANQAVLRVFVDPKTPLLATGDLRLVFSDGKSLLFPAKFAAGNKDHIAVAELARFVTPPSYSNSAAAPATPSAPAPAPAPSPASAPSGVDIHARMVLEGLACRGDAACLVRFRQEAWGSARGSSATAGSGIADGIIVAAKSGLSEKLGAVQTALDDLKDTAGSGNTTDLAPVYSRITAVETDQRRLAGRTDEIAEQTNKLGEKLGEAGARIGRTEEHVKENRQLSANLFKGTARKMSKGDACDNIRFMRSIGMTVDGKRAKSCPAEK